MMNIDRLAHNMARMMILVLAGDGMFDRFVEPAVRQGASWPSAVIAGMSLFVCLMCIEEAFKDS